MAGPTIGVSDMSATPGFRRRWLRRFGVLTVISLTAVLGVLASGATAQAAGPRVDLRALVLDDGTPWVSAVADQFTLEGVPFTRVDLNDPGRPAITAGYLSSGDEAFFQAVVVPSSFTGGLSADETTALATYESQFGIRQVDGYDWANPTVGLNYAAGPGYIGDLNGLTASITPAAQGAGFGYLSGTFTVGVGSYAYLATPAGPGVMPAGGSFTPLVTVPIPGDGTPGSMVGVYRNGGVEQLVITAAMSTNLSQFRLLAHGIVSWATRGVHLGYNRNYLTFHFDDAFATDAQWDAVHHCTPGEDCAASLALPENGIRMTAADVSAVTAWQQANGYTVTLPFNGYYSQYDDNGNAFTAPDPLTEALVANKGAFRWLNHGYQHVYQGCQQNFTVVPWACVTTDGAAPAADGSNLTWVSQADIASEISANISRGQALGLPFDASEYLSGEHSGLYLTPQQPVDNPNFGAALSAGGVGVIGADASREPAARVVGGAVTVPRHPVAVYYNVSTKEQEVSEYNWFYTTAAQGGSGYCETNPATATCLAAPLGATGFTDYIVPTDAANDLRFVLSNDPRPFYAHVSNLTGPDYLGLTLMNSILGTYRSQFATSAPVVNLTLHEAADVMARQQAWATAGMAASPAVSGYAQDGQVTIVNPTSAAAPVTLPIGSTLGGSLFGQSYGGETSGWVNGNATLMAAGLSISSAATATFALGSPGTFAVASSGDSAAVLAVAGTLPAGVTFTPSGPAGTLAGTPAAGSAGVYPLTVSATSPWGTATQQFTLVVTSAPVFTSAASAAVVNGTTFSFTVTTSGYPVAAITRTGTLPAGVVFTANADGTATLNGRSTSNGRYLITFTAKNSLGQSSQSFVLTVGRPPAFTSGNTGTATTGSAFSKNITTSGYPAAAVTVAGLPAGLTFTPNTTGGGVISGTPASGTGGVHPLTLTATNLLGTATQTVTLTVRQPPAITSAGSLTVRLNQAFTFPVAVTGYPQPTFSNSGVLPSGVRFTNSTGILSGTPRTLGSYLLLITAKNPAGTTSQTVVLTVTP